jgi:hypothetical protein
MVLILIHIFTDLFCKAWFKLIIFLLLFRCFFAACAGFFFSHGAIHEHIFVIMYNTHDNGHTSPFCRWVFSLNSNILAKQIVLSAATGIFSIEYQFVCFQKWSWSRS